MTFVEDFKKHTNNQGHYYRAYFKGGYGLNEKTLRVLEYNKIKALLGKGRVTIRRELINGVKPGPIWM